MTRHRRLVVVAIAVGLGGAVFAQTVDPQALQRMVSTERAFAASALELGVRDSFLTYFADDAIALQPGADGAHAIVAPAKDGIRHLMQPILPLTSQLMWAPFTGQVSSDGSLGWLTGAYTNFSVLARDVTGHGAYFSVWKRQPDNTWRVWLDEGITLPQLWDNASPFRVAPDPDAGTAGAAGETFDAAEAAVATGGEAWQQRLGRDVRLHRNGQMPYVGREAVLDWAKTAWPAPHYAVARTLLAASDDLGVALGGYDLAPAEHGIWARVWKRDVTGRWRIVFETSQPAQ